MSFCMPMIVGWGEVYTMIPVARIDEIAADCINRIVTSDVSTFDYFDKKEAGGKIAAAIRAALHESPIPWVPVTERVPNSRFDLLVLLSDGFWHMGHYNPQARRWEDTDSMPFHAKATHWAEVLLPTGVQGR